MSDAPAESEDKREYGIKMYSPWIPREGNRIQATIDVIQLNCSKTEVDLFLDKNTDALDNSGGKSCKSTQPGLEDAGPSQPQP